MSTSARPERRLSAIITVVLLMALVSSMPGRLTLIGWWVPYVVGAALVLPMIGAALSPVGSGWAKAEHRLVLVFVVISLAFQLYILKELVQDVLIHDRSLEPIRLLSTSAFIWVTNVLLFALLYYQLDRGGPDGRAARKPELVDFSFASMTTQEGEPQDVLGFVDYLFLSFTSSTAFSPTDTLPMTSRAKLLMMVQAMISLVTIVVVAARSINILR